MLFRLLRSGLGAVSLSILLAGCALMNQSSSSTASTAAAGGTVGLSNGKKRELRQLGRLLAGNYNSTAQATNDKEYFDIRLHIKRIWQDIPETKGLYYYVEQATSAAQQRPYRQRIYHLRSREDGKLESVVYTVKNPIRFAGQWKEARPLGMLTPDSLIERTGCTVVMRHAGHREYRGATTGQDCPSDLRGAKYAQTDVTITPTRLISWDRGFDEKGEQVWGAKFGGYQFDKERDVKEKAAATPAKPAPAPTAEKK